MEQPKTLRKPIALGNSSLVISLPKEFVKKYKIKAGEPLVTHYDGNCFVVVPNELIS